MCDRALNMKPRINYCVPVEKLGFRGVSRGEARLIPLPSLEKSREEIFFFHGVDVLAEKLPYTPYMGEGSDFIRNGHWHHYEIYNGIFIVLLIPNIGKISVYNKEKKEFFNETSIVNFTEEWVLQSVLFKGEERPRVFLNRINELVSRDLIGREEIKELLERRNVPFVCFN